MKNTKIIANRFSPNTSTPIFFTGRHDKLTNIFSTLYSFASDHSSQRENLYFLLGKNGVGKTTFLRYLYKQILNSREMITFLPFYICGNQCKNAKDFYFQIIKALEQSCRENSFRYGSVENALAKTKWLQDARHIAPTIMDNYKQEKFSISGFLTFLQNYHFEEKMIVELWQLLDYIALKSNVYFIVIFDHMFHLLEDNSLQNIFASFFHEITRYNSRFFNIVSMNEKSFKNISSDANIIAQSGVSKLLDRNNYEILRAESEISSKLDILMKEFRRGQRFFTLGLLTKFHWKTFNGSIVSRITAEFDLIYLQCTSTRVEVFLKSLCHRIIDEIDRLNKLSYEPKDTNTLREKVQKKRDFSETLACFAELLQELDKVIKQKPFVIVLQNYEIFIDQQETLSSRRSLQLHSFSTEKFILPSSTFIKFFHTLSACSYQCKNICILPIFQLSAHEFPTKNKSSLYNLFANSATWKLQPFTSRESDIFLKETFSRSGILVKDTLLQDLYEKTMGLPIHLHILGYYIINKLEEKITQKDLYTLKKYLMTKNIIDHAALNVGHLKSGLDSRIRLEISSIFYDDIQEKSLECIFKEMWKEAEGKLGKEIINIFLDKKNVILSIEDLKEKATSKYTMQIGINFLEETGLIRVKNDTIFVHNALKIDNSIKKQVSQEIKKTAGSAKIIDAPFRLSSEKIIALKNKHKLRTTEKKENKSFFQPDNNTKVFQLNSQQEDSLLECSHLFFRENIFSAILLEKISSIINMQGETSSSIQCIKMLCQSICLFCEFDYNKYIPIFLQHLRSKKSCSLLLTINAVFLNEEKFLLHDNEKNHETSYKLFLLKYKIENSQSDLHQAMQSMFFWLEKYIAQEKAKKYLREIENYICKISDQTKKRNCKIKLECYKKFAFLCYEKQKNKPIFSQEIPNAFSSHLVNTCYFLIIDDISENVTISCIQTLSQYSHLLKNKNNIVEKLVEILPMHKLPQVRYYFYDFLLYTLPLFEPSFCKETFMLLLEALPQEKEFIQEKIIQVISSYPLLMPEEEVFFILKYLFSDREISIKSALILARLAKMFSDEIENSIYQKCNAFYFDNIPLFDVKISSFIPFGFAIESNKSQLEQFILDKFDDNMFDAKNISSLVQDFNISQKTQEKLYEKIINLSKSKEIEKQKKAIILSCNYLFDKTFSKNFDDPLLEDEILKFQFHFFASYSSEEQQEIIKILLKKISQNPLLIKEAHKIFTYFSKEQISQLEKIIKNAILHSNSLFFAQEIIKHSCHISILFSEGTSSLNQLLIKYLQNQNNSALFPAILEGIILKNINVESLEICIFNLLDKQQVFSFSGIRFMYDFFNQSLDRNLNDPAIQAIKQFLIDGINNPIYASIAIPIYMRQFDNDTRILEKLDIYKHNMNTWESIVALCNIFPKENEEINNLQNQSDKITKLDSDYLDANLISFYYRLGKQVIAEEKLNYAIKNAIIPFHLRRLWMIKQKWSIKLSLMHNYVESSKELGALNVNSSI